MEKLEPAGKPVKVASSSGANAVLTQAGRNRMQRLRHWTGTGELDDSYTLYSARGTPFLGSYEFAPIVKSGPFVDIWAGGTSSVQPSRGVRLVLGAIPIWIWLHSDGRPKLRLGTGRSRFLKTRLSYRHSLTTRLRESEQVDCVLRIKNGRPINPETQ